MLSDATMFRYPVTPDGRYFVVRGRLWRKSNPSLAPEIEQKLVAKLMDARRGLRDNLETTQREMARREVDEAKRGLGERGDVWWTDGAPDYNRHLAKNHTLREVVRQQCWHKQ